MGRAAIEFDVVGEHPPLKGEAKSMLSEGHGQARRVRALLEASHQAKQTQGLQGFAAQPLGVELTVRPQGEVFGDATNMLGGVGDTLQSNRRNLDLTYLGELADAFLYDDDSQIREVHYTEEPGDLGYTVRFWVLTGS